MFDVSFSELMLVGVIALVVIGPERLPKVARTIGHLLGRAQRYVSDVKTDIKREMDLEEISSIKGQMEDAAKSVKDSMQQATNTLRNPLEEAQKALKEASTSMTNLVDDVKQEATTLASGATDTAATTNPAADSVKQPDQSTGTPT
ncbi:twin-arginine translocase subunit TatB [Alcaligenaceae bacterium]|nr:twin-arginine translocase subunit TatB [Alcaligenaceae bacterium]